jgi:hypothetical protein
MPPQIWSLPSKPATTKKKNINNKKIELKKLICLNCENKSDNYLLTRSAISSRRIRSFFMEPVDFSNLRKTMGDSTLLAIEMPGISDNPAVTKHMQDQISVVAAFSKHVIFVFG